MGADHWALAGRSAGERKAKAIRDRQPGTSEEFTGKCGKIASDSIASLEATAPDGGGGGGGEETTSGRDKIRRPSQIGERPGRQEQQIRLAILLIIEDDLL